jgi:alanine-glyoxylate transaminase/serine-glyoxylate transaminase/serine-pyruvate transaminase
MCQRHGLTVEIVDCLGRGIPAARFEDRSCAPTRTAASRRSWPHTTKRRPASSPTSPPCAGDGCRANHPALLFVDGVSSIASMPFEFDAWGVDIAVTGSQKGFMLPAGLAITGFSERRWPRWKPAACRAASTTSATWPRANAAGRLSLHAAGRSAERPERRAADDPVPRRGSTRFRAPRTASPMASAPPWTPGGWSFAPRGPSFIPTPSARSARPRASTATRIVTHAADTYGVSFGVGLGDVAGKVFRIGHLGMLRKFWPCPVSRPPKWRWPIWASMTLGSGVAAAQEVYRNRRVGRWPQNRRVRTMNAMTDWACQRWDDVLIAHERIAPYITARRADVDLS